MGQVYLAQDPLLRRQVAVKVMRPQAGEGAERFLHEARTVAGLAHPNIVVLHEFGVEGDQPFLVMEFLPGQSLEAWRHESRPLPDILRILRGLARAVGYAHQRGVLHRDLKPRTSRFCQTASAS
jgi:serine/threonine-protein kinase